VLFARYAFTRVHLYWRVRVPSNFQVSRVCQVLPREYHSASRHPPRVPKAREDQSRCVFSRNCRESHLSLVPRVKDDPRFPLKLLRRTKVLTWAPILAVRWKFFDRVILNLRLFVNCGQKIFDPMLGFTIGHLEGFFILLSKPRKLQIRLNVESEYGSSSPLPCQY
jgi:hypothetical protein